MFFDVTAKSQKLRFLTKKTSLYHTEVISFCSLNFINFRQKNFAEASFTTKQFLHHDEIISFFI